MPFLQEDVNRFKIIQDILPRYTEPLKDLVVKETQAVVLEKKIKVGRGRSRLVRLCAKHL